MIATEDITRAEVIEALLNLNMRAVSIRRMGYTGTASVAYTRQHAWIDDMLDLLDGLPE